MAPDPTFALSEVRVALHSILYMFFWIMITFETMLTSPFFIFKKPEVVNELHRLHENFVLVPADKASNNIDEILLSIL